MSLWQAGVPYELARCLSMKFSSFSDRVECYPLNTDNPY